MIEDFYPYIFSEDLYVFPTDAMTVKTAPATEKVITASIEKPVVAEEQPITPTLQTPAVKQAPIKVLHAGNSSALCVVFWGKKLELQPADRELLNNILKACKLNPADIAFLQADTSGGLLFTDELPASKAIVFCDEEGLKTAKQAQLTVYQTQSVSGKQLLLSDPLSALTQNNVLKGNLWKALQALLGIG